MPSFLLKGSFWPLLWELWLWGWGYKFKAPSPSHPRLPFMGSVWAFTPTTPSVKTKTFSSRKVPAFLSSQLDNTVDSALG
jgi:hypothetical protein